MKLVYPAYFSPLENGEGYCVTFPDLPGAVTQGNSLANAIDMAVDCACGWVLDELEDGNSAPAASSPKDIKLENPDNFVNLVVLDMDRYAQMYGEKAIRKNCTLPAWLNKQAEDAHVNFSAVLQEALIEKLNIEH
jgi:predicted RNase H-like HicB family nuclease